jgi:hypothetical protein
VRGHKVWLSSNVVALLKRLDRLTGQSLQER